MINLRNLVVIYAICIVILATTALAEIFTSTSVEEIDAKVSELLDKRNPEKTLIILPLENFLARPVHIAFQKQDDGYKSILKKVLAKVKLSKDSYFSELIFTKYENKLADPFIPEFIGNIQRKNAPIMVVTSNFSGGFNDISFLEVWTLAYLLDQRIDIAKGRFAKTQLILNKKLKMVNGAYPTFYKGLLSCSTDGQDNSSQQVLSVLLAVNLKWLPDNIIVVDSKKNYLESLEQQFKSLRNDIDFIGFIYEYPQLENATITPEDYLNFWEDLVKKLNIAIRKGVDTKLENPYEQ